MSTWKLNNSEGIAAEDKLTMALSEIQSVLNVVLEKQQAEKDDLTKKYRIASDSFRQGVLRSQLTSLASRQKRLLGILQKQSDFKLQLRTWKGPTLTQHSQTGRDQNISHSSTTTSSPAPSERSLTGNQEESHASPLFSSTSSHDNRDKQEGSSQTSQVAPPRTHPTQHRDDNNKNNTTFPSQQGNRNSKPQHGNTPDMGSNVLQQGTANEEENRKLIRLIKRGVITPGEDVLQLMWRGCVHQASLLLEGWIRDSVTGREFQAPELWVAAILGNNIPVSSAYAWDKVTYGDRSLSGCLLGVVDVTAPAAASQKPAESTHHDGSSAQPQDVPSAGAPLSESSAVLRNIMQIKSIRLIGDEEFVPHHIMDRYWDSLTQTHTDDWLF
ncbi:ankyrin repeat domain-containing protein 31-like [Oncorhynchus nerka]|uniref:ankyrin repeat domain-containing protein 31-like n=1 Tax=Oncorhynchus nerka TaxID=8023 RepID=UPI001130EEE7|nr:putative ankyrin repeat domain-containing protein 31 [Oncorhynchus nerka]